MVEKNMSKKTENFVPPKPLFVKSDTTGDSRPPSLESITRHHRTEYDLENLKLYNKHAMDTCYNLPLEDVTEHYSSSPLYTNTPYTLRYNYNTRKVFFVDQANNEYTELSYNNLKYRGILGMYTSSKFALQANQYKISDGNTIIIMGENSTKTLGPLILTTGTATKDGNQYGGNLYLPITFSVYGSN